MTKVWCPNLTLRIHVLQQVFITDREITRKKYIVSLENRTPEQIAEEEALYVELKRLEQNERKFAKEREDLLRLLAGVESGLPGIAADDDMYQVLFTEKGTKKKRGGSGFDGDSPMTAGPSTVISLGTPVTATKKVQSAKAQANGEKAPILKYTFDH